MADSTHDHSAPDPSLVTARDEFLDAMAQQMYEIQRVTNNGYVTGGAADPYMEHWKDVSSGMRSAWRNYASQLLGHELAKLIDESDAVLEAEVEAVEQAAQFYKDQAARYRVKVSRILALKARMDDSPGMLYGGDAVAVMIEKAVDGV